MQAELSTLLILTRAFLLTPSLVSHIYLAATLHLIPEVSPVFLSKYQLTPRPNSDPSVPDGRVIVSGLSYHSVVSNLFLAVP